MGDKTQDLITLYRGGVDFSRRFIANSVLKINYTVSEIDCPDCVYDDLYKESADQNCSTCGGTGKVEVTKTKIIEASTNWLGIQESFELIKTAGGTTPNRLCIASCKLEDVLVTPSDNTSQTLFEIANYILVNEVKCKMFTTPMKYGLAGDLYSCAVDLIEDREAG